MKRLIFFGVFSILANFTYAQMRQIDVSNIKNKFLDITYASVSDAQKLDIYLPDKGEGPFPVILSIHGGAFMGGDKRDGQLSPMLKGLELGYAVVSINYRLSGEAIWPAQINDCKAAIRWLRANAEIYNLKTDKLVAWGGSAGGHLSSMLGTSGNVKELEDLSLGNAEQSSKVQVVVDWFGPTNFLLMDEQLKISGVKNPQIHSEPNSPESKLLGANLKDALQLVKLADPGSYVTFDDPPFLIQHGIEDHLVPYQGSVEFARKLGKVIGYKNVALVLFPATDHGGEVFETPENLDFVFRFINMHL